MSQHIVCPHCHTINNIAHSRLADQPNCGRCKKPLFVGKPIDLTKHEFEKHIKRNDIPVLVDFWASWCGPCKMMAPAFLSAAKELEPYVRLAKVNTETEQMLAAQYAIRSIPSLILFKQGKEIARQAGAMSQQDLLAWVKSRL